MPPTFLMCLDLDQPDPLSWLTTLNVDARTVLHGEQSFEFVVRTLSCARIHPHAVTPVVSVGLRAVDQLIGDRSRKSSVTAANSGEAKML